MGNMPKNVKPMLCKLVDKPFDDADWLFETKWDGYRAIAQVEKGKVRLYSRNNLDFNEHYPTLVAALGKIKHDFVIDGEIVVFDAKGRSRFQLLQDYLKSGRGDLAYCLFDILYLDGERLINTPLLERKKILKKLIGQNQLLRYSDHMLGNGVQVFKEAERKGLEGVIAKKIDSPYEMGKRTGDWQKVKTKREQEIVISGFTAPIGNRKYFGSLVTGAYEKGQLIFTGQVGGGFDEEKLKDLYDKMKKLITNKCPFAVEPKTNTKATWIHPRLVAQVKFEEWTASGEMRQPIYLGLRVDKKAHEVHREKAK